MNNKNIVLVGLSGSGKSTIGKVLSDIFKSYIFIDTDDMIVKRERRSINDIFDTNGEKYFRKIESIIVKDIASQYNQIISTGGGVVLDINNLKKLKKNGLIFYLKVSPEVLAKRLEGDSSRPLLKTDDLRLKLEKMLDERSKFYEKADFIIYSDKLNIEQTVSQIVRIYNERS